MKYGFIKVATAIPEVRIADTKFNLEAIEKQIVMAEGQGVEIIVFPEFCITGYTCQDLFRQQQLLDDAERAMLRLLDFTRQLDIIAIVGTPVSVGSILLNCAVVVQHGKILGIVPKTYLPNYAEFYEKRWFASAFDMSPTKVHYAGQLLPITPEPQIYRTADGVKFGIEICEDIWSPIPPSSVLTLDGAEIIFNLSASTEQIGKHSYLEALLAQQSARTLSAYVYSSCGFGESTQDVVFGGNAFVYENGVQLASAKRFQMESQVVICDIDIEKLRSERRLNTTFVNAQHNLFVLPVGAGTYEKKYIDCMPKENAEREFVLNRNIAPQPFLQGETIDAACEEAFNIQVTGLAKRLLHIKCKTVVLGISGGLDSTLALLVCIEAFDRLKFDRKDILAVTMPGFGTSDRTHNNALLLMQELGVTMKEISIVPSVTQHFKDIEHDINVQDATYENAQARERTQILMDLANEYNGLVIGTGDLSELALGWCTYNGDHMSMYAVNGSVPKTLVKQLVGYVANQTDNVKVAESLRDIVDTPISPELVPTNESGEVQQKTEDIVGPYELHDFFLYYFLRHGFQPSKIYYLAGQAFEGKYTNEEIKKWLYTFVRRFFNNQFKRSCLPEGPKVGMVSLSPRGDWRMPSDADSTNWLTEIEQL
ncbi:NAD+ synthase [Prevotella disiens JCM 6334 = ATCC 29426]|jgi:NAD+ synthetase|uniref:Glutamine-dependent NAD(+) synthetase n=3 Tax=Prevotella disiens TaxID=28130 RepID=A0A096AS89_9BACT|nr:NAD(+) synthase [Prevotella disiens]ERJ75298.1 NAD+ synthase [Prevotella disiens JCM 6334 = ATCC 29426]KGF49615.1 NAD synthetase [Prevotella disiens DNF00882]SUB97495.1 Glutamine-dependent NAD(+) synthetase [Prevotella disiens]